MAVAFSEVNHKFLLALLTSLSLGLLATWIQQWLQDRQPQVCFEGHTSPKTQVGACSLPQGSPLLPLLWCFYLDTFLQQINTDAERDH